MKTFYFQLAQCVSLWAALGASATGSDAFQPADELVWYDDSGRRVVVESSTRLAGQPGGNRDAGERERVSPAFRVDQPRQGMKWSRDLPPISLAETPWLVIRYRAESVNRQHSDYLIYLRDGNAKEQLSPLTFTDVTADGAWHIAAVDVSVLTDRTSVDQIAVQVQAGPTARGAVVAGLDRFHRRTAVGRRDRRTARSGPRPSRLGRAPGARGLDRATVVAGQPGQPRFATRDGGRRRGTASCADTRTRDEMVLVVADGRRSGGLSLSR